MFPTFSNRFSTVQNPSRSIQNGPGGSQEYPKLSNKKIAINKQKQPIELPTVAYYCLLLPAALFWQ